MLQDGLPHPQNIFVAGEGTDLSETSFIDSQSLCYSNTSGIDTTIGECSPKEIDQDVIPKPQNPQSNNADIDIIKRQAQKRLKSQNESDALRRSARKRKPQQLSNYTLTRNMEKKQKQASSGKIPPRCGRPYVGSCEEEEGKESNVPQKRSIFRLMKKLFTGKKYQERAR